MSAIAHTCKEPGALSCGGCLEWAVLEWLHEVEELPGALDWQGPYTSATDRLFKRARELRSSQIRPENPQPYPQGDHDPMT